MSEVTHTFDLLAPEQQEKCADASSATLLKNTSENYLSSKTLFFSHRSNRSVCGLLLQTTPHDKLTANGTLQGTGSCQDKLRTMYFPDVSGKASTWMIP
jgi:hypothetical protein